MPVPILMSDPAASAASVTPILFVIVLGVARPIFSWLWPNMPPPHQLADAASLPRVVALRPTIGRNRQARRAAPA